MIALYCFFRCATTVLDRGVTAACTATLRIIDEYFVDIAPPPVSLVHTGGRALVTKIML
jgi:hypothetical protein